MKVVVSLMNIIDGRLFRAAWTPLRTRSFVSLKLALSPQTSFAAAGDLVVVDRAV